jgi:hypothetical protein
MANNVDKAMDAVQFALDAAMEQLMAARRAADLVSAAQTEGRDMTDEELDIAANARRAAVQRFKEVAQLEET